MDTYGSISIGSNNTNKYNPQELSFVPKHFEIGSNNTNKYNPQELLSQLYAKTDLK